MGRDLLWSVSMTIMGVAVRETPQLDSALGVNMNGDCFGGNHDCCRFLPDFPRVEP